MTYTEAVLSNSTRKLLWFEITKMLIAVERIKTIVIYYSFRYTFVAFCGVDWRYDRGQTNTDGQTVALITVFHPPPCRGRSH